MPEFTECNEEMFAEETGDSRSDDALIEVLRTAPDDSDEAGDAYAELEHRWSPRLAHRIRSMCVSSSRADQMLGLRMARALSEDACHMLREECIDIIVDRKFHDEDRDVGWEAFLALEAVLTDYRESRLTSGLMRWKDDSNSNLRFAVVWGFMNREDDEAVSVLLQLSHDPDINVRNWATYGLAHDDVDSAEIRVALRERAEDDEAEVRAEALLGLARRDDERAVDLLIRELRAIADADNYWDMVFEAAKEIGDPRLCPELVALEDDGIAEDLLNEAIAACRLPEPEEMDDEPDDADTTCPVCGFKNAFLKPDREFCRRCGWDKDPEQRADPDSTDGWNRRSLNQERARWRGRIEEARRQHALGQTR